jgi:hypothetical protein
LEPTASPGYISTFCGHEADAWAFGAPKATGGSCDIAHSDAAAAQEKSLAIEEFSLAQRRFH